MTTGELKAELARRGLEATGLKRDMVARLQQAPPAPYVSRARVHAA